MANWNFRSAQRVANTHVRLEFVSDTTPPTNMSMHLTIENARRLAADLLKATEPAAQ